MSIVIFKPAEASLSEAILGKCADDGFDGIGFSYVSNGEIFLEKTFKNFDSFLEKFNKLTNNCPAFVHFAESDSPIGSKKFCGPFKIDDNHVLIHSGDVFENADDLINKEYSQTYNLVLFLRKFWSPNYFKKEYLKYLIEKFVGYKNRIIIMNNDGDVQFFNHISFGAGWISKSWFSDTPIGKITVVRPTYTPTNHSNANCYIPGMQNKSLAYGSFLNPVLIPPIKCERCNTTNIPSYMRKSTKGENLCLVCHGKDNFIPHGHSSNLKVYAEADQDLSWIEENKYISENGGPDANIIDIFDLI